MRLLHVFSTFAVGGPQVRAVQLMNAWGPRVEHGIMASDGRYDALALINPDVDAAIAQDMPPLKGQNILRTLAGTGYYLADSSWDRVLTYNWGAVETALANRMFGHKALVHHEDGFGPDETTTRNWKRSLFRRLALRSARAIVVPSRTLHAIATAEWKFAGSTVHYVPNGVDMALYQTPPAPDALAPLIKQPGDIWVGIVSGLRPEKNVGRLIDAFAQVGLSRPRAKLVICGSGVQDAQLQAQAAASACAAQICFAGFQAHPHRYMGLFDIYAISSDTEQFPIAQVEAMAAGAAFCGTDVGDVRAILPEAQRSYVVPAVGSDGLATALGQLLDDPAQRQALGAQNRVHVATHFSFDRMVSTYETLYGLTPEPEGDRR